MQLHLQFTYAFMGLCFITYGVNLPFPLCLLLTRQPPVGQSLLIHEVSRSHTTTHHSRYDSSGRVISSSQRPLPDNTQQSLHTDTHAPGEIRTHNLSRRVAVDLRLGPCGHWDRPSPCPLSLKYYCTSP